MPLPNSAVAAQAATIIIFLVIWHPFLSGTLDIVRASPDRRYL
jgi:hypothetical protein